MLFLMVLVFIQMKPQAPKIHIHLLVTECFMKLFQICCFEFKTVKNRGMQTYNVGGKVVDDSKHRCYWQFEGVL